MLLYPPCIEIIVGISPNLQAINDLVISLYLYPHINGIRFEFIEALKHSYIYSTFLPTPQ